MSDRGFPVVPLLLASLGGVALWLFLPTVVHGAEQRISCPVALRPGTVRGIVASPWRLELPLDVQLTTAGMLHGQPAELGYLAPLTSKERDQGNRLVLEQRWLFDRPHWYQTFVYCGYGGGSGPLQLFHPIAKDAKECTLTSSTRNGVVDQMVFVCK